jgi:hypothetical protein
MSPNIDYSPLYLLLVFPALLILIITVGSLGSRRARIERIEGLREKVKALPLNEKTLEKRLEIFDDICREVNNYDEKIRLLEKLASGKKVSIKRVRKGRKKYPSFSYREDLGCFRDYNKTPLSGIGSRIILGHY